MEATAERDQPLSPAGRLFLQPQLDLVIFAAVAVEHPLDVDAFKAELESSVIPEHPRFCSLLTRDSRGREHWRRTAVDLDRHLIIRHQSLSDDTSLSDDDAVNNFIADLSVLSPFPIDKPLWEVHLLVAHKTMVFRFHHALGDGISLMSMMLSCCRKVDDPTLPPTIAGVGAAARRRRWSVWTLVMVVWYTLVSVLELALRVLWLKDKATAVRGGPGVELWPRKLATARFQLEDMKTVKQAVANATINDVLFGVISFGLSRYLDIIQSPQALREGQRITGVAIVNLRSQSGLQDLSKLMDNSSSSKSSGSGWGNKFGMVILPIYYYHKGGSLDPMVFVKRAKAMIDKKKLSLEGLLSYRIGYFIMSLFGPRITCLLNYRIFCNTTFTISNVVGPKEEITAAGNPVKHIRVTTSSLPHAMTMHMVSYAGIADLQILAAKEIIPDPQILATCFQDALLQMKEAAQAQAQAQAASNFDTTV